MRQKRLQDTHRGRPNFGTRILTPDPISTINAHIQMSLNEITWKVLRLVESRSGIPVHVEPDPSLPGTMLAKVTMARGSLKLHRVAYRPDSSSPPDYLICQQAGFILRLFDTHPEKRFDFTPSAEGVAAIERLVKAHPAANMIRPIALPEFCRLLQDALLHHLRSIPVGMRVDRWLAAEFPSLRGLQNASILHQLQDGPATISPKFQQRTPAKIFDGTQTISAAFASFWANRLGQPQLALPFKAAGFQKAGEELLAIWESSPEAPENDGAIIDAWADKLGIAGWHAWVPYSVPQ